MANPIRVKMRPFVRPLQNRTEEAVAQAVLDSLAAEPTLEEIKQYITLALGGDPDPKAMERILLRIGRMASVPRPEQR